MAAVFKRFGAQLTNVSGTPDTMWDVFHGSGFATAGCKHRIYFYAMSTISLRTCVLSLINNLLQGTPIRLRFL